MHKLRRSVWLPILIPCLLISLAGCTTFGNPYSSSTESIPGDSPYSEDSIIQRNVDNLCSGDSTVAESVNFTLLTLPRWVRTCFQDSGWKILVVDYDIATEDYGGDFAEGDVLGSTAYKDREVRILDNSKAAINAPIHEFGHWLDWYLGYPTTSDENYLSIYESEQGLYKEAFGPACSWNEHEFFAEGFWCYWKSPESLKKICPRFYQYLNDKLMEIKGSSVRG